MHNGGASMIIRRCVRILPRFRFFRKRSRSPSLNPASTKSCEPSHPPASRIEATTVLSALRQMLPFATSKPTPFFSFVDGHPGLLTVPIAPALVSDPMLRRMEASRGELIVEGTFDTNLAVCQTLGALRPKQRLVAAKDAAGPARVER